MLANMTSVAAADGLEFHFERVRAGNTFDAQRISGAPLGCLQGQ